MLWQQVALAATAAAILIPPEISQADEGIFKALPIDLNSPDIITIALEEPVDIPCRECNGEDYNLRVAFAVEDRTKLTLNGYELWPEPNPWHGDLTASLYKGNSRKGDEQVLGYSLSVHADAKDEDQQMQVLGFDLKIIEVGNRFVRDIPVVTVKVIQSPTGELLIADISLEGDKVACDTMWCRTKQAVDDMFKSVKGCAGRHGSHSRPHHGHGEPHEGHEHDHPEHSEGHEQHDMEYDQRDWAKLFKNVAAHILLPVLMGIAAGVGVALMAMVVAAVTVRLTAFFKSERRWCPRHARPSAVEVAPPAEKESLIGAEEESLEQESRKQ